jgi:hypothetical protein
MEEFVWGLGLGLRVDLGLELVDLEVPGPHLVSIGSQGGGGARARIGFEALPAGLGGLSVVELVAALYRQPGRDARVAVT